MDIQEELLQRQLLNLKVKHKAFGEGIVKEVSPLFDYRVCCKRIKIYLS